MAGGKIFINYRREDSRGEARALFDRLNARFPRQVFMDVSTLDPGADFVQAIEDEVGSCDATIVVIGNRWLAATDAGGRRYRFGHQPHVAQWNLARLASALVPAFATHDPLHAGLAHLPVDVFDLPPESTALLHDIGQYLCWFSAKWRADVPW